MQLTIITSLSSLDDIKVEAVGGAGVADAEFFLR